MEHEKHRFQKLTYQELIHLRGLYTKRLNDINKQLSKFIDGEVLGIKIYDNIKTYGYKSRLLEDESFIISEKISKTWKDFGGNISYDILSYVISSCILDKYNYEYNPYNLLENDDINKEKFYRLYIKMKEWLNRNYWVK